jgi:sugar (pentulose or hexulose) kinase
MISWCACINDGDPPMADEEPREQIARLEAQIEELADRAERCRKISVFAKVVIASGGALWLAIMVGALGYNPTAAISATAAVLGGIVLMGANASTFRQTMTDMRAAEAMRVDLIGRIELLPVDRTYPAGGFGYAVNGKATKLTMDE